MSPAELDMLLFWNKKRTEGYWFQTPNSMGREVLSTIIDDEVNPVLDYDGILGVEEVNANWDFVREAANSVGPLVEELLRLRNYLKSQITENFSQIELFVRDFDRSAQWFNLGAIKLYIRVTIRLISKLRVKTLEISNVSVDENCQGCGLFTFLLEKLETLAVSHKRTLYVENVLTERFCSFFDKRSHYTKVLDDSGMCSYFFIKKQNQPTTVTKSKGKIVKE